VEALLAFATALLALRLAGGMARRWRSRRPPQLLIWAASLVAYALAAGALAWGAAAGWDERSFRVYYLFGGLLTAPLLGLGSLALAGWRHALSAALGYAGLAVGVAIAVPLTRHVGGTDIPQAQEHLRFFPARALAVVANSLGTVAVVGVAVKTLRRRPVGNSLIVAGVVVAAAGSALAGLGVAATAAFSALAVVLLYGGFVWRH
jgi:hypothetical protein